MKTRAKGLFKKLAGYVVIELFVPGGTLVILGLLFLGGSFPTIQERVLGILPKTLSAVIRPGEPTADRARALPTHSTAVLSIAEVKQ